MRKIIFITLALLVTWAVPAWANIAALSYTDPGGAAQTVAPSRQYINPAGGLSIYLTAGLDRKVGYVLTDSQGQVAATGVSELIAPADTLTVLGQTYYGKVMTIPATVAEGNYTLAGRILDAAGNVVASQSYSLVVDRTPPAAGEWWRRVSWNDRAFVDNDLLTGTYIYSVWLKNVSDLSGVAAVQFESYDPDTGAVLTSKAGWHNASTQEAGVGSGYNINLVGNNFLPARDGLLGVRFILTDKAGNQGAITRTVKFDGHRNPLPELVAVRNPNVTTEFIPGSGLVGYEPYTPGMTVYENPMKFLYRLPRSNWRTENPDYGVYIWVQPNINQSSQEPPVIYQDDTYVYFDVTLPHSASSYRLWTYTASSPYSIGLSFNVKLAAAATQSPRWLGMSYNRSDTGWTPEYANGTYFLFNNPALSVTQMKVRVEARPYDQVFDCSIARCTIPAGETECIAPVSVSKPAAGNTGGASVNHTLRSADGSYYTWGGASWVLYDFNSPEFLSYEIDRINRKVTYVVHNHNETNLSYWQLTGYGLVAADSVSGQQANINGAITARPGLNNLQITVDYNSLPDGDWQFAVFAQDRAGNRSTLDLGQVVLDRTPPGVQFYQGGMAMSDHDATDSLGKVSFTVTDNVDASPQVESVRFTGGPENTDVYLAYHVQDGAYVLEYPVLYPSAGQDYVLAVTVKDASGNRATRTLSFAYEPPSVALVSGGQETLNLPILPVPIVRADGGNALMSQPITVQGAPLGGVYDLTVILDATSTVPVVLNGVALSPGEMTTVTAYDFAANGGRLNLPLWSDQAGQARLVVTSLAPNFPVLTAAVNFWQPAVELVADPGWTVQPLIQAQRISVRAAGGVPCQATLDETEARNSDPIDSPKCLVEFTQKPLLYQVKDGVLQGVLGPEDAMEVSYQVSLYNAGQKYVLGSGSRALGTKPITGLAFSAAVNPGNTVYRQVQPLTVSLQSTGAYQCRLAVSEAGVRNTDPAVCLVRWTQIPEGLQPAARPAALEGKVVNADDNAVGWTVDLYHPVLGMIRDAVSGSATVRAVEPPLPKLVIEPGQYAVRINDASLVTSSADGNAGTIYFTAPAPSVGMSLDLSGAAGSSQQFQSPLNVRFACPLKAGAMNLWESRTVRARLYYTEMPEVGLEQEITITAAPSRRVQAVLASPREVLDTDGVPVQLTVGLPGSAGSEAPYDAQRDGSWQVRFGYLDRANEFQPLTGYQGLPGSGVLEATLSGIPAGNQKLVAEAVLACPAALAEYSRTIRSNNIYLVVLKGGGPDAELVANRVSGPAPLTAVASLRFTSEDRQIMGDVQWRLSADNGATWQDVEARSAYQASVCVTAGTYLLRAQMTNRLSQAAAYTEAVELVAYEVPALAVTAPASVFVGTPVTLRAQLSNGGEVVPDGDAVVEWYSRTGELLHTGADLSVTPAETVALLYRVRARMANAPETDAAAWRQTNAYIRVLPPMPPYGSIQAPNYMEYNTVTPQTYQLTARVSLPMGLSEAQYPLRGEWVLPDGSTRTGYEIDYAPQAAEVNNRVVFQYRAWVEGYKEQTLATFRKAVLVGRYAWSDFVVNARSNYPVAPALVTLTVMPTEYYPWNLEKPQYVWRLPESVELVREYDRGRIVQARFPHPGSYEVSVDITDARGSTAMASATVELGAAPPFEIAFAPLFSNQLKREPLNILMRPRVTGGHPEDRITGYAYSVDDPKATVAPNNSSGVINGLTAGERTVRLEATSRMGQVVEADFQVSVAANQPPSCEITSWVSGVYTWYAAQCSDSDGRVVSRRWYLDDRLLSTGQSIRRGPNDPAGVLRFEAFDDGGAAYRTTLN